MRDVKYSLDWLLKTKSDLMKMLDSSRQTLKQAKEDTEIWEMMVNDVDAEIAEIQKKQRVLRQASGRVRIGVIIVSVLVIVTIILSGAK
jgi:flagellar biosynthesis/type III secretory pathway chaperone